MSGESDGGPGRRAGAARSLSLALLAVVFGGSVVPLVGGSRAALRSDSDGGALVLPELWIDDASLAEGDSGSQDRMFTLHLSESAAETVTVDVATFDSTATAAEPDYEPVSLQIVFAPGSTAESLAVHVLGDTKYERNEIFGVLLSEPAHAVLRDGEAIGTIINDDLVMFSVADTSVAEGDSGVHPMAFRVRLAQPVDAPVPISFHTVDGTATTTIADQDYVPVSGDTCIAAGQDEIVIQVPVVGDPMLEGNEAFTLQIESAQGTASVERTAIGTIQNDERTSFEGFDCAVPRFAYGTLPPAWGDLNGDDHPDLPLYLASGMTYVEMPGVRSQLGNGNYHGGAWCDYDRDGDMDLVQMPYNETNSAYNFVHLFENTSSGLQDVAPAAGMDVFGYGETATWGDFNADGWPDVFLPFYAHEAPFRSYFYLNLGNGQFQEWADSAGVALRDVPAALKPEGVGVADWNGDGTLDFYCASHLFLNDGHAHFTDVRAEVGLPAVKDEGAQFVDYDNDGDLDLYLRTSLGPTLYKNTNGMYTNATATLGVGFVDWEWGDRWADLDNDGDLDLIFFPPGAVARLLLNRGDGTFEEDTNFVGVLPGTDLCAFADMDGDGDLDIAAGAWSRRFARNHLEQLPRAQTSFLRVRVEDDEGRLVEHGATVRLRSLDDPRHPVQTRIVDGGSGYLGQDEYTVTFGGVGSGRYDLEVSYPTTPDVPKLIGPAQNPLLGGIRPGESGPKLIIVRPNGEITIQNRDPATAGVEPPIPAPLSDLRPAVPNPARRMTRLDFSQPIQGPVTLTIHDLSGRNVRTLVRNGRGADGAGAAWDLRDDEGRAVPAGLYLARLVRKDGRASVRRVIVLR